MAGNAGSGFGLTPMAAGFVAGTTLTAGQVAPATLGCTVTKGTAGLVNILMDTFVDPTQLVLTVSPGGTGPASGTIMSATNAAIAGQSISIQSFRRDTGANVDTDFSFKIEKLQRNF